MCYNSTCMKVIGTSRCLLCQQLVDVWDTRRGWRLHEPGSWRLHVCPEVQKSVTRKAIWVKDTTNMS
jgi:hypothetical protein